MAALFFDSATQADTEEALQAYTISGTWLTREEHLKGTIEVGKLADIAVLDRDYFAVPEEEIKDIQVLLTTVAGSPYDTGHGLSFGHSR